MLYEGTSIVPLQFHAFLSCPFFTAEESRKYRKKIFMETNLPIFKEGLKLFHIWKKTMPISPLEKTSTPIPPLEKTSIPIPPLEKTSIPIPHLVKGARGIYFATQWKRLHKGTNIIPTGRVVNLLIPCSFLFSCLPDFLSGISFFLCSSASHPRPVSISVFHVASCQACCLAGVWELVFFARSASWRMIISLLLFIS